LTVRRSLSKVNTCLNRYCRWTCFKSWSPFRNPGCSG